MKDYVRQNKSAWEFNAYEFWVEHDGTPEERARKDLEDPVGMLKKYVAYFDTYEGIRVANICGSCGKKGHSAGGSRRGGDHIRHLGEKHAVCPGNGGGGRRFRRFCPG
ncbi:MAG: hypothetical protein ACLSA0_25150 [Eisenbergiella massiliensis]